MKKTTLIAVGLLIASLTRANASTPVELTTTNGTVPGTGITYTITAVGDDGGPRALNVFANKSSDAGTWNWTNFDEFLSFGQAQTLTVTFSAPIELNRVVTGVNSTSFSTSSLTVAGGTATTADFNVTDGLQMLTGPTGLATYNGSTGIITAASNDQSVMIGSASANTITSLTLNAGASAGGADGYTVFFGVTDVAAVPEPSSLVVGGVGALCFTGLRSRRRRSKSA